MISVVPFAASCLISCGAPWAVDLDAKATGVLAWTYPDAVYQAQAGTQDPFALGPAPEVSAPAPPINVQDPFQDGMSTSGAVQPREGGCGPDTSLAAAELRKPDMAVALCEGRFADLDKEWLFILYYISGFNEFLEERGAFMDPTGACSRAVEPRQSLSLIYQTIDFVVRRGEDLDQDARFERMLEPFLADWRKVPFVLMELRVWKREGRLDATSVASRGMCGDPKFQLFWRKAIEYAQRVPGTSQ